MEEDLGEDPEGGLEGGLLSLEAGRLEEGDPTAEDRREDLF